MSSRIKSATLGAAADAISASTVGRILGYMVLTIMGGLAGLGYYKLSADVRVLQLDARSSTLERKIDRLTGLIEKRDADQGDQKKQSPRP